MESIEYNKENNLLLNQIHDILVDLQKQITLFKIPVHMGVKGTEEMDKAAKQAIGMLGMTITRLPYTNYYLTTRRARNSIWQKKL